MAQKFSKNDPDENKFFEVWDAMLQGTFDDLTAYFDNAYQSPELGNALWEASAVDVWNILEKTFFIKIYNELISAGYTSGAVDTYCKIIYLLFGQSTVITIELNPLEVTIGIVAEYSNFVGWITRTGDRMFTRAGDRIVFRTLLNDIPRGQLAAIIRSITSAGTKINFNLN